MGQPPPRRAFVPKRPARAGEAPPFPRERMFYYSSLTTGAAGFLTARTASNPTVPSPATATTGARRPPVRRPPLGRAAEAGTRRAKAGRWGAEGASPGRPSGPASWWPRLWHMGLGRHLMKPPTRPPERPPSSTAWPLALGRGQQRGASPRSSGAGVACPGLRRGPCLSGTDWSAPPVDSRRDNRTVECRRG
jgi:hypothetical protein